MLRTVETESSFSSTEHLDETALFFFFCMSTVELTHSFLLGK